MTKLEQLKEVKRVLTEEVGQIEMDYDAIDNAIKMVENMIDIMEYEGLKN